MGLFPIFRKRKPEDICRSTAQKIVISSLAYRLNLSATTNQSSADAGAELVYLLLHLVDTAAFQFMGASIKRDVLFDRLSKDVIRDYAMAVLTVESPVFKHQVEQMTNTLNSRRLIYAQCDSLAGKGFPGRGSMIFAFCFFVHRVLGHTARSDVDDILAGKRNILDSELGDFPEIKTIFDTSVYVGLALKDLRLLDNIKYLARV